MISHWVLHLMSLSAGGGCLAVSHDRVLAEDLTKAQPQFGLLSPDLPLTFAPLPGTQRVLLRNELAKLLRRNGIEPNPAGGDLCVERKTEQLVEADLIAAIQDTLNLKDVHVQVVDYPRQKLPPGTIQFKTGSVGSHAPGKADLPVIWPGRLLYEGGSASIWVKAIIWVEHKAVVAATDLTAGQVIRTESLRLENVREYPLENQSASSVDQVAGLKSRSPIRKDTPISLSQLELPWAVYKGEKVLVRVLAGSTHVSLEAVALSSGRLGDEVALRNPESGRAFRAVVEAKGMALISRRGSL